MASRLSITSSFTSPVQVLQSFINGNDCHIDIIPNEPKFSHAEGNRCYANGKYSHAEGINSSATGEGAHADGSGCVASGNNSHAIGKDVKISNNGIDAISIGYKTESTSKNSISIGSESYANGERSLALGSRTQVNGNYSVGIAAIDSIQDQAIVRGNRSITISCNKIETSKDNTITLSAQDIDIKSGIITSSANNFSIDNSQFKLTNGGNGEFGILADNNGVQQFSNIFKVITDNTSTKITCNDEDKFSVNLETDNTTSSNISTDTHLISSKTVTIGSSDSQSIVSIHGNCNLSSSLTIGGEQSDGYTHYIKTQTSNLLSTNSNNEVFLLGDKLIERVGSQRLLAKSLLGYDYTPAIKDSSGVYNLYDRTRNIIKEHNETNLLIDIPTGDNIDLELYITLSIANDVNIKIDNRDKFKIYSAQYGVLENLQAGGTYIMTISEISEEDNKKVLLINRMSLTEVSPSYD